MSAYPKITSRAIIGMFYRALEESKKLGWVEKLAMQFASDQAQEEYAWLGQSPSMREWIGKRMAKKLREDGLIIKNKPYESTLEISADDIRRDKTGQIQIRIKEQVRKANTHWAGLLSTLIANGTGGTGLSYDGQYFFDTDHAEGSSGSQSNSISVDISALPSSVHGAVTAPSASEMQQSILSGAQQIIGLKDDQGDPINEDAAQFIIMVPTPLWSVGEAALKAAAIDGGDTNVVAVMDGITFSIAVNPRLSWTDKFAIFRSDSDVTPFIRQEEVPLSISAIAEDSELEFTDRLHQYGIYASRGVGYGYWQNGCLVTMV